MRKPINAPLLLIAVILAAASALLSGIASGAQTVPAASVSELQNGNQVIGIMDDVMVYNHALRYFSEKRLNRIPDENTAYLNLKQGRIDAFIYTRTPAEYAIRNGLTGVRILNETLGEPIPVISAISRNSSIPNLKQRFDRAVAELSDSGTISDMYRRWIDEGSTTLPDNLPAAPAPDGTLRIATTGLVQPFSFYANNKLTGFDIELGHRIAEKFNLKPVFTCYDWTGMVAAVEAGKEDIALSELYDRPHYRDIMDTSEPLFFDDVIVMVRSDSPAPGFLESVKTGFYRNLIEESRWKSILSGLGVTCIISLGAGVFGLLLGFLLCAMRRSRTAVLRGIATVIVRIVQGVPVLVLLMIFYYVIFLHTRLSAIAIAIFCFSIYFAAYACEIMRSSLNSVDRSQIESAYALAMNRFQIFFRISLPQAARIASPVLRGEFISLVKMTSVVGYISIIDLTRASDIIRARTVEAFFPLVMTAVLYFLLSYLLSLVFRLIDRRFSAAHRRRSVRGVKISTR